MADDAIDAVLPMQGRVSVLATLRFYNNIFSLGIGLYLDDYTPSVIDPVGSLTEPTAASWYQRGIINWAIPQPDDASHAAMTQQTGSSIFWVNDTVDPSPPIYGVFCAYTAPETYVWIARFPYAPFILWPGDRLTLGFIWSLTDELHP